MEALTCFQGCYLRVGTVCNSLLLPRITVVVALRSFGCSGKLSRLLLGHVHALVADLLGTEPFVWLQHRLGRCIILETQTQARSRRSVQDLQKVILKVTAGEQTRSKHFTYHLNTSSRTRCELEQIND